MINSSSFFPVGSSSCQLSIKSQINMKKEFKNQLWDKNCKIDEKSMQISNGIETMVDSLKNAILQKNVELLKLPILLDFNN